jgi:hypothetical protein
MSTPSIVEISKRPQTKFKNYSWKVYEANHMGALSHIPNNVLPIKDTRTHIHRKLEEFNHQELKDLWDK